jgi:hypothetical protein
VYLRIWSRGLTLRGSGGPGMLMSSPPYGSLTLRVRLRDDSLSDFRAEASVLAARRSGWVLDRFQVHVRLSPLRHKTCSAGLDSLRWQRLRHLPNRSSRMIPSVLRRTGRLSLFACKDSCLSLWMHPLIPLCPRYKLRRGVNDCCELTPILMELSHLAERPQALRLPEAASRCFVGSQQVPAPSSPLGRSRLG